MNRPVLLDQRNPGQFFACCGLLELAHRLWPGATGWFAQDGFHLHADTADFSIATLLQRLHRSSLTPATGDRKDKTSPLALGERASLKSCGD